MEREFLTREVSSENDKTSHLISSPLVYFPSTGNSQTIFKRSQNTTYLDNLLISSSVLIHSRFPHSWNFPHGINIPCLFTVFSLSGTVLDIVPGVLTARESWCHGKSSAWVASTGLLLTCFDKFLNVTGFPSAGNKHKWLDQDYKVFCKAQALRRGQTTQGEKEREGSSAELVS